MMSVYINEVMAMQVSLLSGLFWFFRKFASKAV